MMDSQTKRRRRRHRRSSARGWRTSFVVVAVAALFGAGVVVGLHEPGPASESRETIHPRAVVASDAGGIQSVSLPSRANFNYSVIPGGARSVQELAHAIKTDSVVADAYRDVDPDTMRPETVPADRMAYVSYRKNDRVFWTKKKVRIYEGETILSNGQTEIRGRCGNGISLEPLLPTAEDEPEETEFDALNDDGRPLLVAFNLTPAGLPMVAPPSLGSDVGAPFGSLAPIGSGVGGFAGAPIGGESIDGIPGGEPQSLAALPSSGCSSPDTGVNSAMGGSRRALIGEMAEGDPCEVAPPGLIADGPSLFLIDPPAGDPPGGNPPGLDPLVLQPLLGDDPGDPKDPSDPSDPRDPGEITPFGVNPTPVPEPATLLLFGSGIAGLIARHRRGKKNQ
jgi:hypothetical protein